MSFDAILPEIILTVGGIVLMLVAAFGGRKAIGLTAWGAVALLIAALVAAFGAPSSAGALFGGLIAADAFGAFGKVLIFAIVVILIHCYYGYYASGGPAGVGVAVGCAVRTSIVAVNVVDLLASMAIWGTTVTVRLAG